MNESPPRKVRFSAEASNDFNEIIQQSYRMFGELQAEKYSALIKQSFADFLELGDKAPLLRAFADTQRALYCYPVARFGRHASHQIFVSFDYELDQARKVQVIQVLRILHVRMVPGGRLSKNFE
jgi:plasmid stabilization system protein ParE